LDVARLACDILVARLKGRTVTIVRIGASKKYADNWEAAFGRIGRKGAAKAAAAGGARGKKSAANKPSKKSKARKR
jgi:hypothetical protein